MTASDAPTAIASEEPLTGPGMRQGWNGGHVPDAVALRSVLLAALPGAVLTEPADLACYAYDGAVRTGHPLAVILPRTTEEVVEAVRLAARNGLVIRTRGAGTSLTGGPLPDSGRDIVISTTRMDRVLAISHEDLTATVEAGVVTGVFQEEVERHGLFYPPDPASLRATTLGGNLACNAGGPRGLKYGVTRNYALALEVVLASGEVIWTGARTTKQAVGPSLTSLFVGSEGTLGIITRAILRLLPRPAAEATVTAAFDRLEDAAAAVGTVLASGVLPAAIEIMDDVCIRAVQAAGDYGLPAEAGALLLFRLDGPQEGVDEEARSVDDAMRGAGARQVDMATTGTASHRLWAARRAVSPSLARLRPNKLGEDVTVPRGSVVAMVKRIQEISANRDLPIAVFGHISDGNLHPNVLFDEGDSAERVRMLAAAADIFEASLELGGTISGEHGIGDLKKDFLPLAVDPGALQLLRSIKGLLDPAGIMNPGRLLPDGRSLVQPHPDTPRVTTPFPTRGVP